MICSFKKLSGKNLALLSIIRLLHVDQNIQIKQNAHLSIETLEINKEKIQGQFAIMNYLSKSQRNSEQMERLWWVNYTLQDKMTITQHDGTVLQKKVIKNDHLKTVNKILEQHTFFEGQLISEVDIIAYLKIKQTAQDTKSFPKISSWSKATGSKVDPVIESLLKEFKQTSVKQEKKQQIEEKKQQVVKEEKKQEKPKQSVPKVEKVNKWEKAPTTSQPKKEKAGDEVTPEYLAQFNAQKIKRTNHGQEIYPVTDKKNVLITSALPYVNNVPHLGNIIGCVLSADVFARYCRLRGHNTVYICGTDEYGTATEVKAIQEGCTPQQICDKYFKIHAEIYEWFDIDFDKFGRTSTPKHTEITQDIFNHLHPKYTKIHTKPQTFCGKCNIFLADRYVCGTCPHCNYEDARGDQCDACAKLLDAVDLKDSKCAICSSRPEIKDTTHIYINLPNIQPVLEQWMEKALEQGRWSDNSIGVSRAWLKQGLRERCITRDLKWGTPVPLEEFKNKVFYVWFDAPIGYISITANFVQDWQKWWMNSSQVKLYQFMGKDNVPFHTVIFPSTLIGSGQDFTLLHRISTTEYLNYEDGKFSKSRGVGVFGDNIVETGIPSEVIRYYLLVNRPEKSDSVFTWNDFGMKNNTELLPNIGNLINRTLKFAYKKFDQKVPQFSLEQATQVDLQFIDQFLLKFETEYIVSMENTEIKEGLKKAMELSSMVNKYLQDEKAWEKEQQESKRSDQIVGIAVCAIRLISAVFEPFMPSMSAKINFQLGCGDRTVRDDELLKVVCEAKNKVEVFLSLVKPGQQLNQPIILFRTYSEEELNTWRQKYSGQIK